MSNAPYTSPVANITTFRFNSPATPHSLNSGMSSEITENISSSFTFQEPLPSEADTVVSSTSRSFLECQKLIVIIICLIFIIMYTQFIFFYFSSNDNYVKQPIFTKYITNSSLVLCILLAIPFWRNGTTNILLQRISPSFDTALHQPITPATSMDDQNLPGIAENKTDFLTLDKGIKALLNNAASRKTLSQRYRVPSRECCKQFGTSLKFGIICGIISFTAGILWIGIQNHHSYNTTTTAILLDECIYFISSFIVVLFYTARQSNYKLLFLLNWTSIFSVGIILIGCICSIVYYINTQVTQSNHSSAIEYLLCTISGVMFGIFIGLIDYVSKKEFYFNNVFILFGDVLFMIGMCGFIVFVCLWPFIFIADVFKYEDFHDIEHVDWMYISVNTIIDFIFNIALFLSIALGNGLFVSLNCMICLILEIIIDILTNHKDILIFNSNDYISRVDNNMIYNDIMHLNWQNWSCDILLFGLLLLIIGIIILNTLIIREKQFSRLYCYQSCYYCCSHTRYNEFSQRNKNGIAIKCHNGCCKVVYWLCCFPCCVKCCCCNYRNRDIQYINRTERIFYKYGDDANKNKGNVGIHVNNNQIEDGCCVCGWSTKYEIIQVNPSRKNLTKSMVNQLII